MGVGTSDAVETAAADPVNLVLNVGAEFVGATFSDIMQVLIVTSTFACALSFHNVIARYQFSLARSGVLPRWLGATSSKHHAPSRSSLVVTTISVIMILVIIVPAWIPFSTAVTVRDCARGSRHGGSTVCRSIDELAVSVLRAC
jgi:amino acid transporter